MTTIRRLAAVAALMGFGALITSPQVLGDAGKKPAERPIQAKSGVAAPLADDDPAQTKFAAGGVVTYKSLAGETYFGASIKPKLEDPVARPTDYLVMVDTSASQVGQPMRLANGIVQKLAKQADPADRIALWKVNIPSATKLMSGDFRSPKHVSLEQAMANLENEVPLGDTDLKDGLQAAIKSFLHEGNRRQVLVFLGDGMSIHNPITGAERMQLAQKMVEAKIAFVAVPLGPRLDAENLHGLATGTGGAVVRVREADIFNHLGKGENIREKFVERLITTAKAPILYTDTFKLQGVAEYYPTRLPPLRGDVATLVLGKLNPAATLTYEVTGRVGDRAVRIEQTEKVHDAELDNFFLVTMVDQWKNAKDQPALMQADRALAHAQLNTQIARDELLGQAQMAMLLDRVDAAQDLFGEAQKIDPRDEEAQGGLRLAALIREGKIKPEQLRKEMGNKSRQALLIEGKAKFQPGQMEKLIALAQNVEPGMPPKPVVNPAVNPGNVNDADLLREQKLKEAIEEQKVNQAVDNAIRQARQFMREGDPDAAEDLLRRTLDTVRDNVELRDAFRGRIVNQLEPAMRDLSLAARRFREDAERRQEALALGIGRLAELEQKNTENQRTRERMRHFDNLMDQARYYEAFEEGLKLVEDTVQRGEEPPMAATAAQQMGLLSYHYSEVRELRRLRQERYLATMLEVERSHVPFPDEPPIRFPPAAAWKRLTDRRKERYESSGLTEEDPYTLRKIRELKDKLNTPVTIEGFEPNTPLKEALGFLSERYGMTILIDVQAFQADLQIQEPENQPVKLPKMVNVSLGTILRLLLSQAQATFLIRRDFVEVTTLQRQAAEKVIRVYPVADLVIPIPNSINQNAVNQTQQNLFSGSFYGQFGAYGSTGAFGGFGGNFGQFGNFGFNANLGAGGFGGAAGLAGIGGVGGIPPAGVNGFQGVQGFQGLSPQGAGNGGQLGGQFGLQGGDTSQQLIQLIMAVVGQPRDWAPPQQNVNGAGVGGAAANFVGGGGFAGNNFGGGFGGIPPAADPNAGYGDPNQAGSLGYYAPARALVVKGTSRIHTRLGGGLLGPQAPNPGMDLLNKAEPKPLRDGVLVIGPKKPGVNVAGANDVAKDDPKKADPKDKPKTEVAKKPEPKPEDWQKALVNGVEDPGLIIATADYLAEINRYDQAAEFLKANLRKGVVSKPWVYEALSLSLKLSKGSIEDIERAELSVVDLEPQDAQGYLKASQAMADNKRWDRAVAFCKQASLLDPSSPRPLADGLVYAEKARDVEGMVWAASNILSRDWPEENGKLHDDALSHLDRLKSVLKEANDNAKAERMVEVVNENRQRDLVVTLTYQGEAGVDLLVKEPIGTECSFRQRQTSGGGTLLVEPLAQTTTQTYIAAEGFSGDYQITIRRAWGRPLGSKATLKVIQYQGTPDEQIVFLQTIAFDESHTQTIKLGKGRRTSLAEVSPDALRRSTTRYTRQDSGEVLAKLRNLVSPDTNSDAHRPVVKGGFTNQLGRQQVQSNGPAPVEFQGRGKPLVGNAADMAVKPVVDETGVVGVKLTPIFETLKQRRANQPLVRNAVIPGAR